MPNPWCNAVGCGERRIRPDSTHCKLHDVEWRAIQREQRAGFTPALRERRIALGMTPTPRTLAYQPEPLPERAQMPVWARSLLGRPPNIVAPLWDAMDARPRYVAGSELRSVVPLGPGVYAWYRRGSGVYVGKADSLHDRIWRRHMGQSRSMHTSAFRRNVAEYLGYGLAQDIYEKRVRLGPGELATVRTWIMGCRVAWVTCDSMAAAVQLETDMKLEWTPPLTKR